MSPVLLLCRHGVDCVAVLLRGLSLCMLACCGPVELADVFHCVNANSHVCCDQRQLPPAPAVQTALPILETFQASDTPSRLVCVFVLAVQAALWAVHLMRCLA